MIRMYRQGSIRHPTKSFLRPSDQNGSGFVRGQSGPKIAEPSAVLLSGEQRFEQIGV
jgi:hypothetical protein